MKEDKIKKLEDKILKEIVTGKFSKLDIKDDIDYNDLKNNIIKNESNNLNSMIICTCFIIIVICLSFILNNNYNTQYTNMILNETQLITDKIDYLIISRLASQTNFVYINKTTVINNTFIEVRKYNQIIFNGSEIKNETAGELIYSSNTGLSLNNCQLGKDLFIQGKIDYESIGVYC